MTGLSGISEIAAEFKNVDIVFGASQDKQNKALALLDAGQGRGEILQATGCVLGAADASLTVAKGEISVLMGLSGSGKSTLLRCLNGLNQASRGDVLIYEEGKAVNLRTCDANTLRRLRMERVTMVFQQFALLPWRTVEENVGLGLELRGENPKKRTQVVAEKLDMVGLTPWAKKYAHELSGGMQQRVGLARAFATDADILLMDEPFSALDPLIREHLQNELLALQKQLNKTIVFVSHDLDEAIKIGNHISIMQEGRIVQHGEPEEIVLRPASDYVRQFVAHMNPIKVLRGGSIMTALQKLPQQAGAIKLDWTGHHLLQLGENDTPHAIHIEASPARLFDASVFNADITECKADLVEMGQEGRCVVMASPQLRLQDIIFIRQATGRPVLMVEQGRCVGVVSDEEIYRSLLPHH